MVLNYNGRALMEKYLPSLEAAAKASRNICRLGVIDNQSADDSVAWLKRHYPGAALYVSPENKVLCAYNDVAAQVDDDVLIFMNNDIRVHPDFVDALVSVFAERKDVFCASPRCLSMQSGEYEGGKARAEIRRGVFSATAFFKGYEEGAERPGLTFQAGFGAFDRKKFLALGGYDDLYLPGRLEDADICLRAYRRGWVCVYEPKSIVWHEGGVSFKKYFGQSGTLVINWRNTFLFMWKNLDDRTNFFVFPLWLPLRFFYALCKGRPEEPIGFLKALPLFKKAREKRKKEGPNKNIPGLSDAQIFERSAAVGRETAA